MASRRPAARGTPAGPPGGATPLAVVGAEVAGVLGRVDAGQLDAASAFLGERGGRWFFTGQGRSGLVARMAAMRFGHLGRPVHAVGEATAPAVGPGDHLVALSASGRTPLTLHLAGVAVEQGADLLVVTADAGSPLTALAHERLLLPTSASTQFGGSLFEQCALLVLDAVALRLSGADPEVHAAMQARHANLQ